MSRRPTVLRDAPAAPTVDAHLQQIAQEGDRHWTAPVIVQRRRDVTFEQVHLVEVTVRDVHVGTTEIVYYTDDGFEIFRAPESYRASGIYWYVSAFASPALALVTGNPHLAALPPRQRNLVAAAGLRLAVEAVTDYRARDYTEYHRAPRAE